MKNLMKLLIMVLMVTLASKSFAQTYGVRAGLNLSHMLLKDNDATYSDDLKANAGFHIGATAEFPINNIFSFETGLLLSTKGFREDISETYLGETFSSKSSVNMYYIDIPLTAKVYHNLGSSKFYGVFGPYLGLGLSGKIKSEQNLAGEKQTSDDNIEWGSSDNDNFKRLDMGLTIGAGVEIKAVQIGLTYGLGLANTLSHTDNGAKGNNRVLGISVGYKFGPKK